LHSLSEERAAKVEIYQNHQHFIHRN